MFHCWIVNLRMSFCPEWIYFQRSQFPRSCRSCRSGLWQRWSSLQSIAGKIHVCFWDIRSGSDVGIIKNVILLRINLDPLNRAVNGSQFFDFFLRCAISLDFIAISETKLKSVCCANTQISKYKLVHVDSFNLTNAWDVYLYQGFSTGGAWWPIEGVHVIYAIRWLLRFAST